MTVRGPGDRSRRKSYDTFTPIGPWLTTTDEIPDPHALRIHLSVNGEDRQDVVSSEMIVDIPNIVAYASEIMRLEPGDMSSPALRRESDRSSLVTGSRRQ